MSGGRWGSSDISSVINRRDFWKIFNKNKVGKVESKQTFFFFTLQFSVYWHEPEGVPVGMLNDKFKFTEGLCLEIVIDTGVDKNLHSLPLFLLCIYIRS